MVALQRPTHSKVKVTETLKLSMLSKSLAAKVEAAASNLAWL